VSIRHNDSELRKSQITHIFELSGGIGNQLFQIEAAKMLCSKPVFDKSMLRPPFMKHSSLVEDVVGLERFESLDRLNEMGVFRWNIENKFQTLGNVIFRNRPFFRHLRIEESGWNLETADLIRISQVPLIIRGYFQSHKFLSFTPQGPGCTPFAMTSVAEREADRLKLDESPWAWLHVRRGDFNRVRDTAGLLGAEYYKRGIEYLSKNFGIARFALFSDDAESAANLFTNIRDVEIMHSSNQLDVASTLALMSRAQGAVIGNSTFSYWGAAKNPNAAAIISPSPWFKAGIIPKDLIPPHWVSIDADFV